MTAAQSTDRITVRPKPLGVDVAIRITDKIMTCPIIFDIFESF